MHVTTNFEEGKPQRTWRIVIRHRCSVKCYIGNIREKMHPFGEDVQKARQRGRSERRPEAYPLGYVEDLSEVRTKLAGFFNILTLRFPPCRRSRAY